MSSGWTNLDNYLTSIVINGSNSGENIPEAYACLDTFYPIKRNTFELRK